MKEEGHTAKQSLDIIKELKKYDPEAAEKLERLDLEQAEKRLAFSNLIKKASLPTASTDDKSAVRAAGAELKELGNRITATLDDFLRSAGFSDADIEALDAPDDESVVSVEPDISLKNYTPDNIASTAKIETVLPSALQRLLHLVPVAWLNAESQKSYRLDTTYMSEPLSIVSGTRVESALSPVHRFAQALLVSQDFLSGREDYDFHAGALLVPQTAQLGASLELLTTQVRGDVGERIESLFTGPSSNVDSTIYELLVAAACQNYGRQVEMLRPGQGKTPDMRMVDRAMPMPTVVECKRRKFLLEYEKAEEQQVRAMFHAVSRVLRSQGTFGIVEVEFLVEIRSVAVGEFVSTVSRQARYGMERTEALYPWGRLNSRRFRNEPSLRPLGCTAFPFSIQSLIGMATSLNLMD